MTIAEGSNSLGTPLVPLTSTSPSASPSPRERLYIVVVGHVDHGKSTVVGRLLADTHSLPDGKLERVRATCDRTGRPFEYAFLLDALKDEQSQGITIDVARVFFHTDQRDYVIIDAPGHNEFLKNMVTGAARAQAALLVIDAAEGVCENSRRHGTMLSLLGIQQLAVLVNKMDLVGWSEEKFSAIEAEYRAFLEKLGLHPTCFVPTSGRDGDFIADASTKAPWYEGPTVVDVIDGFVPAKPPTLRPFRMPVQDVYKFTGQGDDRRIVAGTVVSGSLAVGDEVVFYPSGKRSRVRSIESFAHALPQSVDAGHATGFTMTEQTYVMRGELAARSGDTPPRVATRLRASVFWLGKVPLSMGKDYVVRLGTARVSMRVERIHSVMDASTLGSAERAQVERNEVADCTLVLARAIACDVTEVDETTRFVIVDDYEIRGGGIIREALSDRHGWVREKVQVRDAKWERSGVALEARVARYAQRPGLVVITGDSAGERRRALARELESDLFARGRLVYFVGIANILYGVDADLGRDEHTRAEHVRRLAEVAHLMLDAGFILVLTAFDLSADDLDVIRAAAPAEAIVPVWLGGSPPPHQEAALAVPDEEPLTGAVARIERALEDRGILLRAS
jgi:bifunctional enzyme CysN/CysC